MCKTSRPDLSRELRRVPGLPWYGPGTKGKKRDMWGNERKERASEGKCPKRRKKGETRKRARDGRKNRRILWVCERVVGLWRNVSLDGQTPAALTIPPLPLFSVRLLCSIWFPHFHSWWYYYKLISHSHMYVELSGSREESSMDQWTALLGQKYFRRFLTEKSRLALLATLVPNVAIHTFSFKLERAPPTIFNPWWMNGKKERREKESKE